MPISFGGKPKEEDVVSLIAAKKYSRAIEVLKAQLQRRGANPSLRMQLADVLLLAEKKKEAIALLLPLADQYATEGFAAKAVSVLKKIQKIDPGRRDVDSRLARLIEEKQREAAVPSARGPFGGTEAGTGEADASGPGFVDGPVLEIGLETITPISAPAEPVSADDVPAASAAEPAPPVAPMPVAPPAPPGPAAPAPISSAPPAPAPPSAPLPPPPAPPAPPPPLAAPVLQPLPDTPAPPLVAPPPSPAPPPAAETPVADAEIEDYDLLYSADGDEDQVDEEVVLEAEVVEETGSASESMSATQFADELMGLVDSVFQEFPGTGQSPAPAAGAAPAEGRQIVVSPLFRDFSVDEMVAVIEGLKLLTFERGDVILKEGQPGASLYMLTSGRVRAFRRNAQTGRQDVLGDLKEGAFFGEVSILTGHPRMASIVALTRCELLELDRPTLDEITRTHPRVWDVLREFAKQRAG